MTSNRFDPRPNEPYGVSSDGEAFATEAEANKWLNKALREARGRGEFKKISVTITNPDRQTRIKNFVNWAVDDGLQEAMRRIHHAFREGDATEQEIRDALQVTHLDLEELFNEWVDEQ